MSKDQTAVQWLRETVKQMINHGADFGDDQPALMKHLKTAEAKEKEKLKDAYRRGMSNSFSILDKRAEQYYEDTYGTTKVEPKDHPPEHQDSGNQRQW